MIVVDASAVIEILLRTPLGARCEERCLGSEAVLCAPELIDLEVLQALRRFADRGELSAERGREAVLDLGDFPLDRYPHQALIGRVWELRHSITAYDAAYVALAEILDAPLITCDSRLARSHGHSAVIEVLQSE